MGRNKKKKKQEHRDKYINLSSVEKRKPRDNADVLDIAQEVLAGTYYCVGKDKDVTVNPERTD